VAGGAGLSAQPLAHALVLSLAVLLCVYVFTPVRGRAR
jgi:hypothetical protein